MISVCVYQGYKLGIFTKLAEFSQPKTSEEIADALQMKERFAYVNYFGVEIVLEENLQAV